ncbi:MAG TPA: DUF6132 family protein, partial [Bacteroidota bacterium]|nr:DUF6132 family protein [Bacteroidota bacterium]
MKTWNIWVKRALAVSLGSAGGFAYYYFIGCTSGACPITSNPYISTAYGALIGVVLTMGSK